MSFSTACSSVVIAILMPFFFMTTGLRTLIDLNSLGFLDIMLVATGIAVSGKIRGSDAGGAADRRELGRLVHARRPGSASGV